MSSIAYQNKDITSKILAEHLKSKSFEVYGLHLPPVKNVLPTNLPVISANEMRMDNLFELEDDSLAIVDYESTYDSENKIKYLNYIARVLKKLFPTRKNIHLRMIVLYTADVEKADPILDTGCLTLHIEQAFLVQIPEKEIRQRISEKLEKNHPLDDKDLMELIILPLTVKGEDAKKELLQKTVAMAKQIPDEQQQVFALSGILVFSDKIIEPALANHIRRWISMTKVGQIIEEEKLAALRERTENIARKLLQINIPIEQISLCTELTQEEIMALGQ